MILSPFPEDTGKDAVFRKAETLAFIQHNHHRTAVLTPAELFRPQIKQQKLGHKSLCREIGKGIKAQYRDPRLLQPPGKVLRDWRQ